MSGAGTALDQDRAPGGQKSDQPGEGATGYLIGYGLAVVLTVVSFVVARTTLVWTPSIPIALFALAIAQMGVHLVFFLHIGTGPDSTNNVMALAFGKVCTWAGAGSTCTSGEGGETRAELSGDKAVKLVRRPVRDTSQFA